MTKSDLIMPQKAFRFVPYILIMIIALLSSSGCIAIVKGGEQTVKFKSEPEGAVYSYYGKQCKAPCEMVLSRSKNNSMLHIERDGYPTYSAEIAPISDRSFWILPVQFFEVILLPIGIVDSIFCSGFGYLYDFPKEISSTYQSQLFNPKVDIKW